MGSKGERARDPTDPGPTRRTRPGGMNSPGAWEALEREIEACTRCPLHATRTRVVVYRGSRTPKIVFVGEAPGAEEDRRGVPFVGRSGRCLDAAVERIGILPDDFGVLNLIKCRPPGNRYSAEAERTCRPYLERQLALLGPQVLVTLGAHALATLDPSAPRILLCAGEPRPLPGRTVFPLIHPAATLRSSTLARRWNDDVLRLGEWLGGRETPAAPERL